MVKNFKIDGDELSFKPVWMVRAGSWGPSIKFVYSFLADTTFYEDTDDLVFKISLLPGGFCFILTKC